MKIKTNARCLPLLLLAATTGWPAEIGSRDLAPFPGARIESHRSAEEVASHNFVLGAVERTSGAMRVKKSVRVDGSIESTTFQIIGGFSPDEVRQHYRTQLSALGFDIVFECQARACGKSTVWANSVFHRSVLYGPDLNQRYLAARATDGDGERLVAVYITQRGNRQVFAHVETVHTADPSGLEETADLLERLDRDGWVVLIDGLALSGSNLDAGSTEALEEVAEVLAASDRQGLLVVCHLYGDIVADVLAASQQCAGQARMLLDPEGELGLIEFGAGPFAPRSRPGTPRLELIVP